MYTKIIKLLTDVFEELPVGVDLSKGGVGELALAHHLGHEIIKGDKGPDARGKNGDKFEYKISTTDQFNFHFGPRKGDPSGVVTKHFDGIAGAYCAKRDGMIITEVEFVPSHLLVPVLILHFKGTIGSQLNKNYRLNSFKSINK
jgi:hypothetical protein